MSQILFVGGGLDSTDSASVGIGEISGFNDATYAPSAVDVPNGQASWAIFTCLDAALAPTTVVGGQVFFGHFGLRSEALEHRILGSSITAAQRVPLCGRKSVRVSR